MMFPRERGLPRRRALLGLVLATVLAIASIPAVSHAQPPLHHVKYTVFAEQPFYVDIYYRNVDPPNWADFSHNPYLYSPKVEADVGPDQMWVQDVMLANPEQWAMVTATSGPAPTTPNIHCVLAVDGVVVATHQGPKGALCSLRTW
jgi:hypothetical protein